MQTSSAHVPKSSAIQRPAKSAAGKRQETSWIQPKRGKLRGREHEA
jgi:hypothetical protein